MEGALKGPNESNTFYQKAYRFLSPPVFGGKADSENVHVQNDLLPPEILQQIFILARNASLSRFKPDTPYFMFNSLLPIAVTPPWNLSQVCTGWRQAALGYSQLWSCVGIDSSCAPLTEGLQDLLSVQLARAGTSPLSISISISQPLPSLFLKILAGNSRRWKSLRGSLPDTGFLEAFAVLRPSFTSLEALEIHILALTTLSPTTLKMFRDLPRFKEIYGDIGSIEIFGLHPFIAIAKMVILPPAPDSVMQLKRLLLSHPSLEELLVRTNIPYHPMLAPSPVKMLHLRRLVLNKAARSIRFLHYLTAPGLQELNATLSPDITELKYVLNDFLSRSECSLRTLSIHIEAYDTSRPTGHLPRPYSIVSTLKQCPDLRTLMLQDESGLHVRSGVRALTNYLLGLAPFRANLPMLTPMLEKEYGPVVHAEICTMIIGQLDESEPTRNHPPALANDPEFLPELTVLHLVQKSDEEGMEEQSESERVVPILANLRPSWTIHLDKI